MYCWCLTRTEVLMTVKGDDVLLMVNGYAILLMANQNCGIDDG